MLQAICILLALLAAALGPAAAQTGGPQARPPGRLGVVKSWGYQLQKPDPAQVARSPYDLVVIDYSRAGDNDSRFDVDDLKLMQQKPDGSRRIVLAYLSIGEAESYRYYWREDWVEPLTIVGTPGKVLPPPKGKKAGVAGPQRTLHLPRLAAPIWLGRENENWAGNYLVRYWEPGWQRIIFGSPEGYLERILAAGFDGVYLDRVDAFHAIDDRPVARRQMIDFVTAIATQARRTRPDFAIVPQNAEDLLSDPAYLAVIDGIGKEDLLYGQKGDGERNPAKVTQVSSAYLALATERGLPVLAVEYLSDATLAAKAKAELAAKNLVPFIGARSLERLVDEEEKADATAPGKAVTPGKGAPDGRRTVGGGRSGGITKPAPK